MIRVPTHREPTHPGEMLLEEFLIPMGITQRELAQAIHVPYQRVNELVNKRRGITPSTALRLSRFFAMSEGFWMNLQFRWDLYRVKQKESGDIKKIKPYEAQDNVAIEQISPTTRSSGATCHIVTMGINRKEVL